MGLDVPASKLVSRSVDESPGWGDTVSQIRVAFVADRLGVAPGEVWASVSDPEELNQLFESEVTKR